MASTDYDFVFKTLLIGNSSVGKSSLLLRFSDNTFQESFYPTIGVDFKIRTFEHEGSVVKLQMWDTAGQEKFKTITSAYYKGAQGIILVFDLCDKKSFQDIQNWIGEVERYSNRETVKVLVGNKCDLVGERQVTREEAETFASNEGMIYMEASAKSNKNVEIIFTNISGEMKKKLMFQPIPVVEKENGNKKKPVLVSLKTEKAKPAKMTCCWTHDSLLTLLYHTYSPHNLV